MGIQKPIFYSTAKIVEDMNNFHQIADNTFGSLILLFREPQKRIYEVTFILKLEEFIYEGNGNCP